MSAITVLGSTGEAGTYGVEGFGSSSRVVWHYRATDERRTFTLRYRITGLPPGCVAEPHSTGTIEQSIVALRMARMSRSPGTSCSNK